MSVTIANTSKNDNDVTLAEEKEVKHFRDKGKWYELRVEDSYPICISLYIYIYIYIYIGNNGKWYELRVEGGLALPRDGSLVLLVLSVLFSITSTTTTYY